MAYKAPGAYARFVPAPVPVTDPNEVRVLGIIGTGKTSYTIESEVVSRSPIGLADSLANGNVFEIKNLTSKPLYQGNNRIGSTQYRLGRYETVSLTLSGAATSITNYDGAPDIASYKDVVGGDFAIVEDKHIVWRSEIINPQQIDDFETSITKTHGPTPGSEIFADNIKIGIDPEKLYLLKNSSYRFEVTHVGESGIGMYSVIDNATGESIGEFIADEDSYDKLIIGGLQIQIATTEEERGTLEKIEVNDYCVITVNGPKADETVTIGAITNTLPTSPYYVRYTYKKPKNQYIPKVFYNYDQVVKEYGNYDIAANGKVLNSLSLAAEIAMLNGAAPIVCLQVESDNYNGYINAINKLTRPFLGAKNVNAVVCLSDHLKENDHMAICDALKKHVEDMALPEFAKERIAYVSTSPNELSFMKATEQLDYMPIERFNSERVVYVFPLSSTKDVKNIRTGVINRRNIGSSYFAVACAALSMKNDPAEPLTNKQIFGFRNIDQLYSESEMNLLAENGCLVLRQDGEVIKVRHGITTSSGDLNSSEITLVQIKDYVMDRVRTQIGDTYIGNKLKPGIVGDIKSSLISILGNLQGRSIILGYNGLTVTKSETNATQIDIKFEVEAVYPLNYIDITFSFSGVN